MSVNQYLKLLIANYWNSCINWRLLSILNRKTALHRNLSSKNKSTSNVIQKTVYKLIRVLQIVEMLRKGILINFLCYQTSLYHLTYFQDQYSFHQHNSSRNCVHFSLSMFEENHHTVNISWEKSYK